ncbi:MAG TPA: hypothetical protein VFW78_12475 [Bacteroidia bacterium]|nr:hypothetical protein [Bacteroidia bacterium]
MQQHFHIIAGVAGIIMLPACSYQSNPYTETGTPEKAFVYFSTLVDTTHFTSIELLTLQDSVIEVRFSEDPQPVLAIPITAIHTIRIIVLTQKHLKNNSYSISGGVAGVNSNAIGFSTEMHHNTGNSDYDFGLPATAGTSAETFQRKPNVKPKARSYIIKGRKDVYLQFKAELANYLKRT